MTREANNRSGRHAAAASGALDQARNTRVRFDERISGPSGARLTTADGYTPPIWREVAGLFEWPALLLDPVWHGLGVAAGNGHPVMLVPGFLAGDLSLAPMARWLRRCGYRTCSARLRLNAGCAGQSLERLGNTLQRRAAARSERVAIVGQSRGGMLARALAVRHPSLVSGLITMGSPVVDPYAAHPLVHSVAQALASLGDRGFPGVLSSECTTGPCCASFRTALEAPFPADVPFVAIYSRTDGVVDWRSCLDPAAEHVDVRGAHVGMNANPRAYRAIADALASFWSNA